MNKFNLYVGLNDKDTKTQEISTLEAYKLITNIIVANDVTGFTVLEANGYYVHDDKSISIEKSLKIEMMFIDLEDKKNLKRKLKNLLENMQKCISRMYLNVIKSSKHIRMGFVI